MSAPAPSPAGPPAGVWSRRPLGRRLRTILMRAVPLGVYGKLAPRRVIGMCYHVVSDRDLPHVRNLYRYKTPAQFEADLRFLRERFHVASYAELESGEPLPANSVVLTFDDGLAECYTVARPLLQRHRLPCTFFVSPPHLDNARMFSFDRASLVIDALRGREEGALRRLEEVAGRPFADTPEFARWLTSWIRTLDAEGDRRLDAMCAVVGVRPEEYLARERPYMTREQVRALAADGFTIGGHGLRHVALGAFGAGQIREEIVESCREAAALSGAARVPFAFPFDADGVDRGLLEELRREHPHLGLIFDTRALSIDRDFVVNRLIADVPPALGRNRSNLATYLRDAYWEVLAGGTRRSSSPHRKP